MPNQILTDNKADRSRQRILDSAARLFYERGYAAVSMRAIAAESGMKAGSVYYHFSGKEQIVSEVLDLGIDRVHHAVEPVTRLKSDDAQTLVQAAVTAHLRALHEFSHYTSANVRIFGQVPEQVRHNNLLVRRRYENLWRSILERAMQSNRVRPGVDLDVFLLMIIGSLNATLEWFQPERGSIDELAQAYTDIFLNGLLNFQEDGNGQN